MDIWLMFLCVFAMGLVALPAMALLLGDPQPPRPKHRKRRPF